MSMYRIEEILKEKGLNKKDLASIMGITKSTLSSNLKNPSLKTLKNISNKLNVPLSQFFNKNDLYAFIEFQGIIYKATSVDEIEEIVKKIKDLS